MSNQRLRYESSIRTFAILDIEINDYHQHQFNQCSIMELCIYGISAKCLNNDIKKNGREVYQEPELPRVLNRINLMINPQRRIKSNTGTGLDNYMLEYETPFEDDTAECILKFINRLEKPVCLVAHNGIDHDFRILRHVYEKINKEFPSTIFCIDSLSAFREIDLNLDRWAKVNKNSCDDKTDAQSTNAKVAASKPIAGELKNDEIDWQAINETTPNKQTITATSTLTNKDSDNKPICSKNVSKVKRQLQFDEGRVYRGYRLETLNKSVFKNFKLRRFHQAETDVKVLSKLVIHYGLEFLEYAEKNKQTFDNILQLGAPNIVKRGKKL